MAMTVSTRFPPPEVLELIFSNLERMDLLNSRLVCDDWNKDCLNFFKKSSKFRLTLDPRDAGQYIKFVNSKKPKPQSFPDSEDQELQPQPQPQPVMPIHLKLNISQSDRDVYKKDYLRRLNEKRFNEFASIVKKLQNLFGRECIRDLTLIYPQPYEQGFFQKLVKVLSDLSQGLEKLDIALDSECLPLEGNRTKEFAALPKVKHLNVQRSAANICWKIIQACPNLETLVLGHIYEECIQDMPWPSELPFPPPGIKSLAFKCCPTDWLLKKLQEHPSLPPLDKIVGGFVTVSDEKEWEVEDAHRCQEILNLLSSSLRSLTLPLMAAYPCSGSGGIKKSEYKIPFSTFPALRNLKIAKFNEFCSFKFKIDPSAFPVLESVDLPIQTILNQAELTQFPTVKSLALRISFCDSFSPFRPTQEEDDYDEGEENEYGGRKNKNKINYYLQIFPNISTISLVDKTQTYLKRKLGTKIKKYLKRLLQLPEASKIKTLELIDFDQNYLGEVLDQIQHPPRLVLENLRRNPLLDGDLIRTFMKMTDAVENDVKIKDEIVNREGQPDVFLTIVEETSLSEHYLKNIQKIRLILTEKTRKDFIKTFGNMRESDSDSDSNSETGNGNGTEIQIKLYLAEMVTNFPHLEEIEISSILFGYDDVDCAERMQSIRKKFPELRINII